MEFKRLIGNRIYLEMPKKEEESKLIVGENTKEAVKKELLSKMSRLKVYAVGDLVTNISVGDEVLVDPEALARKATIVPLSQDKEVLLVSPFDIVHVWA
jgi:hypothetical protein